MKSMPPSRRVGALSPAAQLYRAISKEVPRVLTIYDIDMDYNEVKHPGDWRIRAEVIDFYDGGRIFSILAYVGTQPRLLMSRF